MSVTTASMENQEITFVFELIQNNTGFRDISGHGRKTVKQLPWCYVRFSDTGEDRNYIMPLSPTAMMCGGGHHLSQLRDLTFSESSSVCSSHGASFMEFAEFAPFPYEKYRKGASDETIPGPISIHFFGGV